MQIVKSTKEGTGFKILCSESVPKIQKLWMSKKGSSVKSHTFKGCNTKNSVRIAYIGSSNRFDVKVSPDNSTNMVKIPPYPSQVLSQIPWDWEVLEIFFKNNNIEPTWISANGVYGILDKDTQKWTGAVGMESFVLKIYFFI